MSLKMFYQKYLLIQFIGEPRSITHPSIPIAPLEQQIRQHYKRILQILV